MSTAVIRHGFAAVPVLVVDGDRLVRLGLRALVERLAATSVVGEAADPAEALERARELRPRIVLRGAADEAAGGEGAFRELRRLVDGVRIVVVGTRADPLEVERAFAAGADAYLVRSTLPEQLPAAIDKVLAGQPFLDPYVGGRLATTLASRGGDEPGLDDGSSAMLARREREVLALLARGFTNKEIAAQLGISYRTVERHRTAVARKLGRHRRSELVAYAREHGLA
jgi:DNA-binding NarL/FixJ family response regulator